MGHDISSRHSESDVAYLRRGAGNPLNQVIYLALGLYDEAYCGCSGSGERISVTIEQLETAIAVIGCKDFLGMKRPRNFSDLVVDMFRSAGCKVTCMHTEDGDVTPELDFLNKTLSYCRENDLSEIEIYFG